jgi:hypothetical protein
MAAFMERGTRAAMESTARAAAQTGAQAGEARQ